MNIAVLCDGAGLARLGLEQAGHTCTGYEIDPSKHHLSLSVGSGNCILADMKKIDLSQYDGIWVSPPCQTRSRSRTQGTPTSVYSDGTLLSWSLELVEKYPDKVIWIENVRQQKEGCDNWGSLYNASQFLPTPIQNRQRIIGGNYLPPHVYRPFSYALEGVCPAITATEHKGCATDTRRASRFYGRRLTLEECAYHQGLTIPESWYEVPPWYTVSYKRVSTVETSWIYNLYEAIGNGVPVYMSFQFGKAYPV